MFVGFLELHHWNMNDLLRNRSGMHSLCECVYIYISIFISTLHMFSSLSFRKCYSSIAPQYSRYPSSYIQLDLRHMWVKHLKSSALESCSLNKDFWSSVGEIPTSITEKKHYWTKSMFSRPSATSPNLIAQNSDDASCLRDKKTGQRRFGLAKTNNLMKPAISQLWSNKWKHSWRHGKYQLNQKTIG